MSKRLSERLREVFELGADSWALEYEGVEHSWAQVAALADKIVATAREAGLQEHDPIGWVAENTAGSVAVLAGCMLNEHCAALLNPHMAPKILAQELREQKFAVVAGSSHFWDVEGLIDAARDAGTVGLLVDLSASGGSVTAIPGLEKLGPGKHRDPMPGYTVERLSSGTTGPPKRSPQSEEAILAALAVGERKEKGGDDVIRIKTSPTIIYRPLAHAGSFAAMLALYSARPIALQEKFSVEHTVLGSIQKYRPKVIQLVPTMIKMIWDADVPKEALSSLIAARSGTAPLDPKLQDDFETKYGFPILIDYGATEFGGVATWTMQDHAKYAKEKRGSVGRAIPGAQIRIVDPETGVPITDGETTGILEVQVEKKTEDWTSTTDLAVIDKDGFLYIKGRADDAIVRGGFKVLPDDVIKVLRQHPDVKDVAVVGVPDERLGAVPVAVIELQPGVTNPDPAEFKQFAREHLTPYQVPVGYKFVDALPRTHSMKVVRAEVLEIAKG
jgi:long-chain acyl-CoA synthetase